MIYQQQSMFTATSCSREPELPSSGGLRCGVSTPNWSTRYLRQIYWAIVALL